MKAARLYEYDPAMNVELKGDGTEAECFPYSAARAAPGRRPAAPAAALREEETLTADAEQPLYALLADRWTKRQARRGRPPGGGGSGSGGGQL